jgi:parallel beta-helix repeat protein
MLNIPGFKNLFHGRTEIEKDKAAPIVSRAETIIIAKDGTGDTDDIQEGINMLSKDGGEVVIKEGSYYPNKKIIVNKQGISIRGIGKATKIYTSKFEASTSLFEVSVADVNITNMYLNLTNDDYDCYAINFGNTGGFASNLWIEGGTDGGIDCSGAGNIITQCYFKTTSGGVSIYADRNIVSNNIFEAGGDPAIYILTASNNIIDGNIIFSVEDDGINISDDSNRNIVTGNRCFNNTGHGIEIAEAAADYNLIHGNIVNNNTAGQILDNGTNTTLADNIVL